LLEVDRLSIRFGEQEVLRDLTFQLPRKQTLAIIGESGCGKTVLLKALIGLQRPTEGSVRFDGADIAQMSGAELARQRTRYGFVFQHAALFDSMTIGENVAFPLVHHTQKAKAEIEKAVLDCLFEVGLPPGVAKKRPAELSGGMRKRVGLARALVMNPDLLLYDEPTTGLDPIMADVINELMSRTARMHSITSIVVTHDMTTARKVADRVIMLFPVARLLSDARQMLFDGPPDELDTCDDPRVTQFVRGEAGERITEMRRQSRLLGRE